MEAASGSRDGECATKKMRMSTETAAELPHCDVPQDERYDDCGIWSYTSQNSMDINPEDSAAAELPSLWKQASETHSAAVAFFPGAPTASLLILEIFELLRDPTVLTAMRLGPRACARIWAQANWESYRVHHNVVYTYFPVTAHWGRSKVLESEKTLKLISAAAGLCVRMHRQRGDVVLEPETVKASILATWAEFEEDSVVTLCALLNAHSDYAQNYLKSTQTWKAPYIVKLVDSLLRCRNWLELDLARAERSDVLHRIQVEGNVPQVHGNGIAFLDCYLEYENGKFRQLQRGPGNNCYSYFPYRLCPREEDCSAEIGGVDEYRKMLRSLLRSFYWRNPGYQRVRMSAFTLGIQRVGTGKIYIEVGRGEDSKGSMFELEESALEGNARSAAEKTNCGTLDHNALADYDFFRKGASLLHMNMARYMTEAASSPPWVSNVVKRIAMDEAVDSMVNFGQVVKVKLGTCFTCVHANYEGIPLVEKSADPRNPPHSWVRRIVAARCGKFTLTNNAAEVDEDNGNFLRVETSLFKNFLKCEVTSALYMKEYVIPFMNEFSTQDRCKFTQDLEWVDSLFSGAQCLVKDRDWLARKMTQCTPALGGDSGGLRKDAEEAVVALLNNRRLWIAATFVRKCAEIQAPPQRRAEVLRAYCGAPDALFYTAKVKQGERYEFRAPSKPLEHVFRATQPMRDYSEKIDVEALEAFLRVGAFESAEKKQLAQWYLNFATRRIDSVSHYYYCHPEVGGRRIQQTAGAGSVSTQFCKKTARSAGCRSWYWDVDMVNSHPTIALSICSQALPAVNVPTLEAYVLSREDFATNCGVAPSVLKVDFLAILNGKGAQPEENGGNAMLRTWRAEAAVVRRVVISAFPGVERYFAGLGSGELTTFSYCVQRVEGNIVAALDDCLRSRGHTVAALIFDGVHVEKRGSIEDLRRSLDIAEGMCRSSFGVSAQFCLKQFATLPVVVRGTQWFLREETPHDPIGNRCIYECLASLGFPSPEKERAAPPSYKEVLEECCLGATPIAFVGGDVSAGRYLLHCGSHCYALVSSPDGSKVLRAPLALLDGNAVFGDNCEGCETLLIRIEPYGPTPDDSRLLLRAGADGCSVELMPDFLSLLRLEAEEELALVIASGSLSCPLCVRRAFDRPSRLRAHFAAYHRESHCCVSSKQLRIAKALYDEDCFRAARARYLSQGHAATTAATADYLKRSSAFIRASVSSSPIYDALGVSVNNFDEYLAIALDGDGPKLIFKADACVLGVSRCGDFYVSESFKTVLLAAMLDPSTRGCQKTVANNMIQYCLAANSANTCAFLFPTNSRTILRLMEHVLDANSYLFDRARQDLAALAEFRKIAIDGTFKSCFGVTAQLPHRGADAAVEESADVKCTLTYTSMSGCLFDAHPVGAEGAAAALKRLKSVLTETQLSSVEIVAYDRPADMSAALARQPWGRNILVVGDPKHRIFEASQFYGDCGHELLDLLNTAHRKFALGAEASANQTEWQRSAYYTRSSRAQFELTPDEREVVARATDPTTSPSLTPRLRKTLRSLDCATHFASRLEYLTVILAIVACYPESMQRSLSRGRAKKRKVLKDVLLHAMRVGAVEHLANAARFSVQNNIESRNIREGTLSNEAVRREMKCWARNVYSQGVCRHAMQTRLFVATKMLSWLTVRTTCLQTNFIGQAGVLHRLNGVMRQSAASAALDVALAQREYGWKPDKATIRRHMQANAFPAARGARLKPSKVERARASKGRARPRRQTLFSQKKEHRVQFKRRS